MRIVTSIVVSILLLSAASRASAQTDAAEPATRPVEQPTLITLDFDKAKASDVAAEISRQAKVPVRLVAGGKMGQASVTIHCKEMSFWHAIYVFCNQAGLEPTDDAIGGVMLLDSGKPPGPPEQLHDCGLLTIVVKGVTHTSIIDYTPQDRVTHDDHIDLVFLLDPKLRIGLTQFHAATTEVRDDQGNSMLQKEKTVDTSRGVKRILETRILLDYPDKYGTKISSLKGYLGVNLASSDGSDWEKIPFQLEDIPLP